MKTFFCMNMFLSTTMALRNIKQPGEPDNVTLDVEANKGVHKEHEDHEDESDHPGPHNREEHDDEREHPGPHNHEKHDGEREHPGPHNREEHEHEREHPGSHNHEEHEHERDHPGRNTVDHEDHKDHEHEHRDDEDHEDHEHHEHHKDHDDHEDHEEASDASTRDEDDGTMHHWTYDDTASWGEDNPACLGHSQSPISFSHGDINTKSAGEKLVYEYRAVPKGDVTNNGHAIQVDGDFGTLELPDGVYDVKQLHFHFPSEHAIEGHLSTGEMHIVHQKKGAVGADGLAVIGILLQGEKHLSNITGAHVNLDFMDVLGFEHEELPGQDLANNGNERHSSGKVDLNAFEAQLTGHFFHYYGSLTTPPCSETVHWYVMTKPAALTHAMVLEFARVLPTPSRRPVQDINGRDIKFDSLAVEGEFQH